MLFAIRILVVLLASTVAGAAWAGYQGFPWIVNPADVASRQQKDAETAEKAARIPADRRIDVTRFRELIAQRATIIDARNTEQFAQEHLLVEYEPPVLNIPPEEFLQHLDRLFQVMGTTMVLYCNSETCHLAEELYVQLEEQGFTQAGEIFIYTDGWEGILKTDLPRTSGPDEWTGYGSLAGNPYAGDPYEDAPLDDYGDPIESDPEAEEEDIP